MKTEDNMNRIRVVLAEKELTNRWLAKQLGKSEMTISRWSTNSSQPSMTKLFEIARVLDVDPKDLIESPKQ